MSARRAKSRKRSAASSDALPDPPVFYLDRNFGKHLIADALREAGHAVEIHDDHLPIDAPDEDWIALVARQRWIALTKDKNIRYRSAELAAVRDHGARVVVLRAKNATGEQMAAMFVRHAARLVRYAATHRPPFVVGMDRSGALTDYPLE